LWGSYNLQVFVKLIVIDNIVSYIKIVKFKIFVCFLSMAVGVCIKIGGSFEIAHCLESFYFLIYGVCQNVTLV
jgi:hypothetical protein